MAGNTLYNVMPDIVSRLSDNEKGSFQLNKLARTNFVFQELRKRILGP